MIRCIFLGSQVGVVDRGVVLIMGDGGCTWELTREQCHSFENRTLPFCQRNELLVRLTRGSLKFFDLGNVHVKGALLYIVRGQSRCCTATGTRRLKSQRYTM